MTYISVVHFGNITKSIDKRFLILYNPIDCQGNRSIGCKPIGCRLYVKHNYLRCLAKCHLLQVEILYTLKSLHRNYISIPVIVLKLMLNNFQQLKDI